MSNVLKQNLNLYLLQKLPGREVVPPEDLRLWQRQPRLRQGLLRRPQPQRSNSLQRRQR